MTLHIAVLGIEVITLTLDIDHHDEPKSAVGETGPQKLRKNAKRTAAWWALKD